MAAILEQRDRNVIPRWRDFRNTIELGELHNAATKGSHHPLDHDLSDLSMAWQQNRSRSFAGDLISSAIVSGNFQVAREAAEFIALTEESDRSPLSALARRILEGNRAPETFSNPPFTLVHGDSRGPIAAIAESRRALARYPNDAILWMDLAYLYVVRGLHAKAERAVKVALSLAPKNRFILRSAVRFYVHQEQTGLAHELIRRSPLVKLDPWLAAAEISVALAAGIPPWSVREGFALINSGQFSDSDLSELASAIGTLEFSAGSNGKAKKLFKRALLKPNDNSLAQAKWISRAISGLAMDVNVRSFEVARSYEANAHEAYAGGEWARALECSLKWLEDQPFSSRPAHLASYMAGGIFEDFERSLEISRFALVANPEDASLRLNLVFCLASSGELEAAKAELNKVKPNQVVDGVLVVLRANQGLIAYRSGDPIQGRFFYEEAVRLADGLEDKRTKAAALLYWAREEAREVNGLYERLIIEGEDVARKTSAKDLAHLLDRTRKLKL